MSTDLTRHAFTVEEWHRMGEAGLFDEDTRVELLDGEVVEMSPVGPRHAMCVNRLSRLLMDAVGDGAIVAPQNPIVVGDRSEPQPDLALLIPPYERYLSTPTGADTFLVIEVADTSLARDRDVKAPLYGRGGIPETWIVNLQGDEVLVLGSPSDAGYLTSRRARRGTSLHVPVLADVTLKVDDILGPA